MSQLTHTTTATLKTKKEGLIVMEILVKDTIAIAHHRATSAHARKKTLLKKEKPSNYVMITTPILAKENMLMERTNGVKTPHLFGIK